MYLGATELGLPAGIPISTNTSPLNLGQVGSIIYEISAEIEAAAAGAGYAVPIAPPASGGPTGAYTQLVAIAKYGVGWRVLREIFPNVTGTADRSSLASEYRTAYLDALKAIRSGSTPLVGAGWNTTDSGRALPRSSGNASPVITTCWVP